MIAPAGVFLIEIKPWSGRIEGDAGTWIHTKPDGTVERCENPCLLAERKAKRLKSLLSGQRAIVDGRAPLMSALVFLSVPNLDCQLGPAGRQDVFGPEHGTQLPDVLARITSQQPLRVDSETAARVRQAMDQAGIRSSAGGGRPSSTVSEPARLRVSDEQRERTRRRSGSILPPVDSPTTSSPNASMPSIAPRPKSSCGRCVGICQCFLPRPPSTGLRWCIDELSFHAG